MNIHAGYFALSPALNPFSRLDAWLNPRRYHAVVTLREQALLISWTERARRAMQANSPPLTVEMQLYFSCVVKKRVLFHLETEFESVVVNERLRVTFRPVQSTSCDPVEFARNYPVEREFNSVAANKMHPKWLQIDYQHGRFVGDFGLCIRATFRSL